MRGRKVYDPVLRETVNNDPDVTWGEFIEAGLCLRRNLVRPVRSLPDGRRERFWAWHDTKAHRPRYVPLPTTVAAALRSHRARMAAERLKLGGGWRGARVTDLTARKPTEVDADLMFPRPDGGSLDDVVAARQLRRVCDKAGVQQLTPHDLRHLAGHADAGGQRGRPCGPAARRPLVRHHDGSLHRVAGAGLPRRGGGPRRPPRRPLAVIIVPTGADRCRTPSVFSSVYSASPAVVSAVQRLKKTPLPRKVTLSGSPPNAAALRRTQRSAACWSCNPKFPEFSKPGWPRNPSSPSR